VTNSLYFNEKLVLNTSRHLSIVKRDSGSFVEFINSMSNTENFRGDICLKMKLKYK
jgi:hypothetical protein